MARSDMISVSSLRSLCSVVLAMIMASLSLTPVASQNHSSILNGVTVAPASTQLFFVGCSFIFDSYRIHEPVKTVLQPGEVKNITIDDYQGVKQVECDLTWYAPAADLKYHLKAIVWFFTGPPVTRFKFDSFYFYYAVPPSFNFTETDVLWTYNEEYLYTPNFLNDTVVTGPPLLRLEQV